MATAPAAPPPQPLDRLRTLALQTAAGGGVGVTYGVTAAFLRGQPPLFLASAYGVNAALFTGSFLGAGGDANGAVDVCTFAAAFDRGPCVRFRASQRFALLCWMLLAELRPPPGAANRAWKRQQV